jgi:hypothetical protein
LGQVVNSLPQPAVIIRVGNCVGRVLKMFKLKTVFIAKLKILSKSPFKGRQLIPLALVALLLGLINLVPVSAAGSGLNVTNALILANVNPGQTLVQKITVNIGSNHPATDITVQITGVSQALDGGFILLDASQDTGAYSARTFVSVDKSTFQLQSGASQDITATVQIPQNVGAGGRYAMINIMTGPASGTGVSMREAVNVPVYLTTNGSQINYTGKITQVGAGNIVKGKPLSLFINFQNTGNCHFKIQGSLVVKDPQGKSLGTIAVPITSSSIIPGMTRQLLSVFNLNGDLAPGIYSIDAAVSLENGTILDNANGTFEVKSANSQSPAANPAASPSSNTVNLLNSTSQVSPNSPTRTINPITQAGGGISWVLGGSIIGGILLIGFLLGYLFTRRISKKKNFE